MLEKFEAKRPKGVWERVSDVVLDEIRLNHSELLPHIEKIKEYLNNPEFKDRVKNNWKEQSEFGKVEEDPEDQEKLWAQGIILKIKEKFGPEMAA